MASPPMGASQHHASAAAQASQSALLGGRAVLASAATCRAAASPTAERPRHASTAWCQAVSCSAQSIWATMTSARTARPRYRTSGPPSNARASPGLLLANGTSSPA
eukprot:3830594-Pyramimonas_sp.AAC.1